MIMSYFFVFIREEEKKGGGLRVEDLRRREPKLNLA